MYAISKTSNSEILQETATTGPALPTISELNRPISSKLEWIWRGWRSIFFLPNGELLTAVKLHKHLQPRLANPAPTASDVYLVTRPIGPGDNALGSLQHWSFYTQGIFYHLSAPDLPRDNTGKTEHAAKSRDARCTPKYQDLRDVNSEEYVKLRNSSKPKLLLAYKVGQTEYTPDQIRRLAQWTVDQLSTYGLFRANCQHFATTMVRRSVMRLGDRSAFAGTPTQIADWDLMRDSQPHVNSIENDYLIAPPLPGMQFCSFAVLYDILFTHCRRT